MSAVATRDVVTVPDSPAVRHPKKRWTRFILPVFTLGMIVYLAFPVFVMILYSFNIVAQRQVAKFTCCTLQWWRQIGAIKELNDALVTSVAIGLLAATIATMLGTLVGLVLGRYSFRGRGATNFVIFLAIAVPEIVLGSALLAMFVQVNSNKPLGLIAPLGFGTILFSHVAFSIAFVAITVRARVQGLDIAMENAAQDLYATPRAAFFKVTFPLILPGIVAGFLLAFVLSLDDFVITNFVNGTRNTFPTWVFGVQKLGFPVQVNVWGTVLFTIGVVIAGFQLVRARLGTTAS